MTTADLNTAIRIEVLDAFSAPLRRFGIELHGVGEQAKKVQDHFKIAGDLNQAAEGMGRFSDLVIGALEKPIDDFAEFDEALARVSAKSGEMRGASGFEALKDQAEDLGASTKYAAAEIANAQADFLASGRNVQETLTALPTTQALATAGTLKLARATEITNEVLNQFQLSADKTAYAQNVLARADEVSAASIDDLGEALSYVGTTANSLKIPLNDTSTYLALLADAGLKGSRGGTSFQSMLSKIKSPSKEATKALGELGIQGKSLVELQKQISTGRLDEALKKIAAEANKLAPEKRTKLLSDIFGLEGERAATVLLRAALDTGDKGFDSYREKFRNVDGAVERTAKIMESHLGGSIEKAQGALSGLSTTIGEIMSPTVRDLAAKVEHSADGLRQLVIEYPEATRASLELVAGLAAITLGLKGLLLAQSAYHGSLGALNAAYGKLSTSLVGQAGLIAAVGLASYAIGTWVEKTFGLADKISSALGRPGAEQDKGSGEEVYGFDENQTVISSSGELKRLGKDPEQWPQIVKDARSAGYKSMVDITAYIRQRRQRNQVETSEGGVMLADVPRTFGAFTPLRPEVQAAAERAALRASGSSRRSDVLAVANSPDAMEAARAIGQEVGSATSAKEQVRLLREIRDSILDSNRRRPPLTTPTPTTQGSF